MRSRPVLVTAAAATLGLSYASAQFVVSAPGMEARQDQKNIFDHLKYAWEQAQWGEKLATLHSTLTTVREHLQTANQVKQAIGDPAAAVALIDSGLFSDYLAESGVGDTLGELAGIAQEGAAISATVQDLFEPIDLSRWKDLSVYFDGVASFRDGTDPLKRYRAVQNAYARFETIIGKAQNKRRVLNQQIAKLNRQLKGAKDDAEVQKLVGSLATAQTALQDLDAVSEAAGREVEALETLTRNRAEEEAVAAEEISRERNRSLAQLAIEADNEAGLPEFGEPDLDSVLEDAPPTDTGMPPGF